MFDTIETRDLGTRDGFKLSVRMVYDEIARDDEWEECYTAEMREAFENDEWSFVGTIVTASKAGVQLGEDSLWGSEYGQLTNDINANPLDNEVNGYLPQMIDGAIRDANNTLERLSV